MNHTILIVEDSEEDSKAIIRAFKKVGVEGAFYLCEDGDEALDYLYQRGRFSSPDAAPRPTLVLLDLNLPGTDGREVVKVIKEDPNLHNIPVVILSTSDYKPDVQSCYKSGANTYVQKPVGVHGYHEAIAQIKEYWLDLAVLPSKETR